MTLLLRKSTTFFGILAVLLLAFFVAFFAVAHRVDAAPTKAQADTLLTIHDRGVDRIVLTSKPTIGDALKEAGITVADQDVVEPALSQELVASEYQVNIYRARPVIVVDGMTRQKVMTPYQTAEQIASSVGITLYAEDKTAIVRSDDIVTDGAGLQLVITRATPFSFTLYGSQTTARTQAKTVGDMLKEKNIVLGADDKVSPDVSTAITNGMSIQVWREGKQTVTVEEPVAFQTTKIQDANQDIGYKQTQTVGESGTQNVTYEILIRDGQEVSRTKIASIETKPAVQQVEVVGTKLSTTFSGSFAEALARLRKCEAGGVYSRNSGNGYYGAYQYDISTWADYLGYHLPSDAPAAVQDEKAWLTYQKRGWQPWPSCRISQGLQDIYR